MKKLIALALLGLTLTFLVGCTEKSDDRPEMGDQGQNMPLSEEPETADLNEVDIDTSELDSLEEDLNYDWLE